LKSGFKILPLILVLVILFIISGQTITFSQVVKGRVLSEETGKEIPYVNLGVIGKNHGTVTDISGNFSLELGEIYDNDSIRFSIIGYTPKSFLVRQFRYDGSKNIFLKPVAYGLQEVKVIYHKPRTVKLGEPILYNDLRSGFGSNDLGSELGVKIHVRGIVKLKDLKINVAICTYDSVTYRLNIYTMEGNTVCDNILRHQVYFSFSKNDINKPVNLDLTPYSIVVEGDILVSLEIYRELGEGKLLFNTTYFTDVTYHKKTSEGTWSQSPGKVGISLTGISLN
jgi:hypothetical protein